MSKSSDRLYVYFNEDKVSDAELKAYVERNLSLSGDSFSKFAKKAIQNLKNSRSKSNLVKNRGNADEFESQHPNSTKNAEQLENFDLSSLTD